MGLVQLDAERQGNGRQPACSQWAFSAAMPGS